MKVQKTRMVRTPSRATDNAAGIDFYIPYDFNLYEPFKISPGQSCNIPSGIIAKFEPGFALVALNKSGIASKYHLVCGAQVVDSDYQGEIHLNLINVGISDVILNPGQKIMQFVLTVVSREGIEEVKSAWGEEKTIRGSGAFGSSDMNNCSKIEDILDSSVKMRSILKEIEQFEKNPDRSKAEQILDKIIDLEIKRKQNSQLY